MQIFMDVAPNISLTKLNLDKISYIQTIGGMSEIVQTALKLTI